jgi:hypothetical protein
MITQEQYTTAEEAFKSLNIGQKFDKRHTARRCKAVEKALNNGRWTKYATAKDYSTIFRNYPFNVGLKKSIKIAQVNNSNDILLFSDQYHFYESELTKLQENLAAASITIQPFVKTYNVEERINAEKWWIDLKNIKMHCDGYEYLSRGMLVGFVISSGV